MSAYPFGSVNLKLKTCDEPLPELGVTETGSGGPDDETVQVPRFDQPLSLVAV
jgi:hypothetical protein